MSGDVSALSLNTETVWRILTVFSLQQLLKVLLRFLLHYRLAGADI